MPIFTTVEALAFVLCWVFLSNLCFTLFALALSLLKGPFCFPFLSGLTSVENWLLFLNSTLCLPQHIEELWESHLKLVHIKIHYEL